MRKIYQARLKAHETKTDHSSRGRETEKEREREKEREKWPRGTLVAGELRVQIQVCLKNTL